LEFKDVPVTITLKGESIKNAFEYLMKTAVPRYLEAEKKRKEEEEKTSD
jgi:hypothetical protein